MTAGLALAPMPYQVSAAGVLYADPSQELDLLSASDGTLSMTSQWHSIESRPSLSWGYTCRGTILTVAARARAPIMGFR